MKGRLGRVQMLFLQCRHIDKDTLKHYITIEF
jgi:hypothetical protein